MLVLISHEQKVCVLAKIEKLPETISFGLIYRHISSHVLNVATI